MNPSDYGKAQDTKEGIAPWMTRLLCLDLSSASASLSPVHVLFLFHLPAVTPFVSALLSLLPGCSLSCRACCAVWAWPANGDYSGLSQSQVF